jgi:hypothetical protein
MGYVAAASSLPHSIPPRTLPLVGTVILLVLALVSTGFVLSGLYHVAKSFSELGYRDAALLTLCLFAAVFTVLALVSAPVMLGVVGGKTPVVAVGLSVLLVILVLLGSAGLCIGLYRLGDELRKTSLKIAAILLAASLLLTIMPPGLIISWILAVIGWVIVLSALRRTEPTATKPESQQ